MTQAAAQSGNGGDGPLFIVDSDEAAEILATRGFDLVRATTWTLPELNQHRGRDVRIPAAERGVSRGAAAVLHAMACNVEVLADDVDLGSDDLIAAASIPMFARPPHPDQSNAPNTPPLAFTWAGDVQQPSAADELVEGLISRASKNFVFGASGCGKTFIVVELALACAVRQTFLNRCRVRQTPVAYFASEAGRSVGNRFIARRRDLGIGAIPVAIVTTVLDLRSPMSTDTDAVIATIIAVGAKIAIIDTFNAVFAGGEENSSQDMGLFLANCNRIVEATGVALIIVHHIGKDANRGLRGHTSLHAAADTVLEVTNSEGLISVKVVKHRDAPIGTELQARLRVVDLGYEDGWGNTMTSCVVDPLDAAAVTPPPKPAKLPAGTDIPFRALREAIADYGEPMPGTSAIPAGVKSITGEAWRRRYYTMDALDVSESDPKGHAKAVEARGKRFTRARVALQSANLIGACNDRYWVNS